MKASQGSAKIVSESVERTLVLGEALARGLAGGELIGLIGELGTGKTQFVKGLARGLGVDDAVVNSPTFTLINEYPGRRRLIHIDAYRLERAEELAALGFEEICSSGGVVVVEWADRVWEMVEPHRPITIRLAHRGPTERELELDHAPGSLLDRINPPSR